MQRCSRWGYGNMGVIGRNRSVMYPAIIVRPVRGSGIYGIYSLRDLTCMI